MSAENVRPLTRNELQTVRAALPRGPAIHDERLAAQEREEGLYLFAWIGAQPVGHAFVKWTGRAGYAEVQDVGVAPAHRRLGVGRDLMAAAEHVAWQRGARFLGLAVAVDNNGARAFYRRLGYEDAGLQPFEISYEAWGDRGIPRRVTETCTYLRRRLGVDVRELTAGETERVDARLPLARLDSAQTYLVAWDGDEPVGHAHVAWQGTKLGIPEVQDVFVRPERRRSGVGSALMEAAERVAAARGHGRISLGYGIANGAARRLYERLGYCPAGLPPERVQETITIRGRPVEVDDTLVYVVKDVDSNAIRSS